MCGEYNWLDKLFVLSSARPLPLLEMTARVVQENDYLVRVYKHPSMGCL